MFMFLFVFALYTLTMWFVGYFAPKRVILQAYRETGVKLYWVDGAFGAVGFVLMLIVTIFALSPMLEELQYTVSDGTYRLAGFLEDVARAEFLVFPAWLTFFTLPGEIKDWGH